MITWKFVMLIIYIIIFVTSHQKGREWKIKRVGKE